MSTIKFIGCLHLGHDAMARFRNFNDSREHDEYLIKSWNLVVNKRDIVYILGDITMETPEHYYKLDQLKGIKRVVLGNHDRPKDVPELLKYVDTVSGIEYYKGNILTHCPIHPNEVSFGRSNIHAHIHYNYLNEVLIPERYGQNSTLSKPTLYKYHNVDAHRINFRPKTLEELGIGINK